MTFSNISFSRLRFLSFICICPISILVWSYTFLLTYFFSTPVFSFSVCLYLTFSSSGSVVVLCLLSQILSAWMILSSLQICYIFSGYSCIHLSFVVSSHLKQSHFWHCPNCTLVAMYLSHVMQFSFLMF